MAENTSLLLTVTNLTKVAEPQMFEPASLFLSTSLQAFNT